MFIHGGGFTGGTKLKPEIVEMGNYYASRGWVFVSVDYRTTEELGTIITSGMTPQKILSFYRELHLKNGSITPWKEYKLPNNFSRALPCTLHKEMLKLHFAG